MAAVLTLALLVFVDGFMSLILDRDIVEEPDAGPLVGPVMAASVCAIVLVFVVRRDGGGIVMHALAAGLTAVVVPPAIGAVGYSVARGELGVIPVFFGTHVLSPFGWAAGVIAAAVVVAAYFASRAPGAGSSRR